MRYLLILGFLLLAGTAVAGDFKVLPPTKDCPRPNCLAWTGPDIQPSNTMGPYRAGEEMDRLNHKNDCLALMEQAMKAMEPYTLRGWSIGSANAWRMLLEMDREQFATYELVQKQWDAAKRDCWTTP